MASGLRSSSQQASVHMHVPQKVPRVTIAMPRTMCGWLTRELLQDDGRALLNSHTELTGLCGWLTPELCCRMMAGCC